MAVKIVNPTDEYNYFFLKELLIGQASIKNITDPPKYIVSFSYRKYKINQDDSVEYSAETGNEYIEDYFGDAYGDILGGDMTLMNALTGNQSAIIKIVNDTTAMVLETV